jgi:hypothetical protein
MLYEDLEELLNEYNWDDGFETPKEILINPYCDLALALKIFYLADGFAYLEGAAEKSGLSEWKQFINSLYNNILDNKYKESGRQYEIPLTKVQKHKFRKKQIPEIFLTDL